jgi:uncharacterized Zn-finger protein
MSSEKHNAHNGDQQKKKVICCPPLEDPDADNKHPRVYLQPDSQGKILCPYCGAVYQA